MDMNTAPLWVGVKYERAMVEAQQDYDAFYLRRKIHRIGEKNKGIDIQNEKWQRAAAQHAAKEE